MPHLVLELALWILLAFFIGCIAGCLLRRAFHNPATDLSAQPAQAPEPPPAAKTARPKPARKTPGRSK